MGGSPPEELPTSTDPLHNINKAAELLGDAARSLGGRRWRQATSQIGQAAALLGASIPAYSANRAKTRVRIKAYEMLFKKRISKGSLVRLGDEGGVHYEVIKLHYHTKPRPTVAVLLRRLADNEEIEADVATLQLADTPH